VTIRKNRASKTYDHLSARILSPGKLFVFWQLEDEKVQFMSRYFNLPEKRVVRTLRLYDLANGRNDGCIQEIVLRQDISSWLFKGVSENRSYVVELGIKLNEEKFFPVLRSNEIISSLNSIESKENIYDQQSPGWVGQVSTYTYYDTLEGSSKSEKQQRNRR
jgi:hypothetical protein